MVWTRRAKRHVGAAYDYWERESSPFAADTMLERIFSAVELLERHSEAGRRGRVSGTRELVIPATPLLIAYRIAYRVRRRRIEVLALLHGARKWPDSF